MLVCSPASFPGNQTAPGRLSAMPNKLLLESDMHAAAVSHLGRPPVVPLHLGPDDPARLEGCGCPVPLPSLLFPLQYLILILRGRRTCLISMMQGAWSKPGRQHRPRTPSGGSSPGAGAQRFREKPSLMCRARTLIALQSIGCYLRATSSGLIVRAQVPSSAEMTRLPCGQRLTLPARCLLSAPGTKAQDSLANPLRQSRCPCPAVPQQPR